MSKSSKDRGNAYVLSRLAKLERDDLLEKIQTGDLSVYAAAIEAGIRKRKSVPTLASRLTYHWSRASKRERSRFLIDNFKEIDELRKELIQKVQDNNLKAQKPSE